MAMVPGHNLSDQARDANGYPGGKSSRSSQEDELTDAIAALLDTADRLALFMHARYSDEEEHAFRRAHYAAQRAQGDARELLRRLDVGVQQ